MLPGRLSTAGESCSVLSVPGGCTLGATGPGANIVAAPRVYGWVQSRPVRDETQVARASIHSCLYSPYSSNHGS